MNNYEKTLLKAEKEFVSIYQQGKIASAHCRVDADFLYITYFNELYRVSIHTGKGYVKRNEQWQPWEYNQGMVIFDILCEPKEYRSLSGEWVPPQYFTIVSFNGNNIYQHQADLFASDIRRFSLACLDMGGKKFSSKADAAYIFEMFPFFPMVIQVWEGEDGIPGAMRPLFDSNTMDFIRYETVYIALGYLVNELVKRMQ